MVLFLNMQAVLPYNSQEIRTSNLLWWVFFSIGYAAVLLMGTLWGQSLASVFTGVDYLSPAVGHQWVQVLVRALLVSLFFSLPLLTKHYGKLVYLAAAIIALGFVVYSFWTSNGEDRGFLILVLGQIVFYGGILLVLTVVFPLFIQRKLVLKGFFKYLVLLLTIAEVFIVIGAAGLLIYVSETAAKVPVFPLGEIHVSQSPVPVVAHPVADRELTASELQNCAKLQKVLALAPLWDDLYRKGCAVGSGSLETMSADQPFPVISDADLKAALETCSVTHSYIPHAGRGGVCLKDGKGYITKNLDILDAEARKDPFTMTCRYGMDLGSTEQGNFESMKRNCLKYASE